MTGGDDPNSFDDDDNGTPVARYPSNPPYYKVGGIETWDYLVAKLSREELIGACKANVIKYLSRAGYKYDKADEEYEKALWYMQKLRNLTRGEKHEREESDYAEEDC